MMLRLPSRVAHWSGCLSIGLLTGSAVQAISSSIGAGPGSLLGTAALLAVALGVISWWRFQVKPAGYGTRISLVLTPVAIGALDWIQLGTSWATHRVLGATTETWLIASVILGAALIPTATTALRATRWSASHAGPALLASGLYASTFMPSPVWSATAATVLAALSDTPLAHERKRPARQRPDWGAPLLTLVAGAWLATGWVHLRTVFDPSVSGLLTVAAGAAIGSTFVRTLPGALWSGLVGGALWLIPHGLELAAPQVGALAMNTQKLYWLSLPLFGLGLLAGPLCRLRGATPGLPLIALAVGLWLGPMVATQDHIPWIAVALLTLAGLFTPVSSIRVVGALGAATIVLADGWLEAPSSVRSRSAIWARASQSQQLATWTAPRAGLEMTQHGLTDAGSFIVWKNTGEEQRVSVTIDGLETSSTGRLAGAEEMAGHLGALLAPMREPMVILGDKAGNVLRGVAAHPDGLTHISAPLPHALRQLASLDDVRERLWLQPTHPLYPEHPARLMSRMPDVPVVVEVTHAPWTDSANWGVDQRHIQTVSNRLLADGIYVLCAHTRYFPDGQVAAVGALLSDAFAFVQVWLPPEGADSAIFVASNAPIAADRIRARFGHGKMALETLGFPTADSLAGAALLGRAGIATWSAQASARLNASGISTATLERPTLHLGAITDLLNSDTQPWGTEDSEAIAMVRSARMTWLSMLRHASLGDMEAAFSTARDLSSRHGEIGASAVNALITPHIKDGQAALAAAVRGDPGNSAWDDALRFATTARMLAPNHHLPLTLLGDISLARGRLPKALEHYQAALTTTPDHIPALEGIARWARLSQSPKQAEQALRMTTRHAPRDWKTWHNLGIFLLEQGRIDEAAKAVDSAVGLAPTSEPAPSIALTTILLDQGQSGAALLRADALTKAHPENGLSWFLRGRAHYGLNRMAEAEEDFRKAVLTDSDLIEARGGIGMVRAVLGDSDAAANIFRDILKRDPGNAAARENLRRLGETSP